jgi:hypothetical protein
MEKEFVTYELALKMKQLGFEEPCLACYYNAGEKLDIDEYVRHGQYTVLAPLFQQAFRWFREKYDFSHSINKTYRGQYMPYVNGEELLDMDTEKKVDDNVIDDFGYKWLYDSYEEAELACLEKLIKIVEENELNKQSN